MVPQDLLIVTAIVYSWLYDTRGLVQASLLTDSVDSRPAVRRRHSAYNDDDCDDEVRLGVAHNTKMYTVKPEDSHLS